MAVFAQLESNLISERTKAGRKPAMTGEMMVKIKPLLEADVPVSAIAKRVSMGRSTSYKHLQQILCAEKLDGDEAST
jgi:DNA invertase Pin-like site-specific DNA recombinase